VPARRIPSSFERLKSISSWNTGIWMAGYLNGTTRLAPYIYFRIIWHATWPI